MTEPIEPADGIDTRACRVAEEPDASLRDGMQVAVYRLAITRRPFIEGTATILAAFDDARGLYWVRFNGERVPRLRLVHAGTWQSEPDATLRALLAHWRDARSLEALGPFPSDDGPTPREGR